MKRAFFVLCAVAVMTVTYGWWRVGKVVTSRSFDGFLVQVRAVPNVNSVLSDPPGIAESAYIIEIGGKPPVATYRVFEASTVLTPIEIIPIGKADEHTFEVRFSNKIQIGVRFASGHNSLVEWYRPERPQ